jgi:hypothetical protein
MPIRREATKDGKKGKFQSLSFNGMKRSEVYREAARRIADDGTSAEMYSCDQIWLLSHMKDAFSLRDDYATLFRPDGEDGHFWLNRVLRTPPARMKWRVTALLFMAAIAESEE